MTPRIAAGTVVAALLFTTPLLAEEPLKSGPPVGAQNNRSGFRPQFVTGPTAGMNLCPV